MKILLINFHHEIDRKKIQGKSAELVPLPSLTLMQLAALTPKEHTVDLLDAALDIRIEENYDIIGISSVTSSAVFAYNIADKLRKKGVPVVLGGWHASALPEEAKGHADAVVVGEAEESWPRLLRDFENGEMKPFYRQTKPVDINFIPMPKRESIDKSIKIAPVQATRGCTIGCEFCAITHQFAYLYRKRPIDQVVKEIESIPQKFLFFCDASLTIDPDYTKQLFKKIKDLNKKLLMVNGNVNVLNRDEELLKLASEAGCLQWHTGFETISQENLRDIGKKTNIIDDYISVVKKIHDHGMDLLGEFVFGFDHDKPEIFRLTEEFVRSMDIDAASFNILTPYPGTRLFSRLEREGRILTKNWSRYSYGNVVFKPKFLTEKMLTEETDRLNQEFFYSHIDDVITRGIHQNN